MAMSFDDLAQSVMANRNAREFALQEMQNAGYANTANINKQGTIEAAKIAHPEFLQKAQAGAWDAEGGYKRNQGALALAHADQLKMLTPAMLEQYGIQNEAGRFQNATLGDRWKLFSGQAGEVLINNKLNNDLLRTRLGIPINDQTGVAKPNFMQNPENQAKWAALNKDFQAKYSIPEKNPLEWAGEALYHMLPTLGGMAGAAAGSLAGQPIVGGAMGGMVGTLGRDLAAGEDTDIQKFLFNTAEGAASGFALGKYGPKGPTFGKAPRTLSEPGPGLTMPPTGKLGPGNIPRPDFSPQPGPVGPSPAYPGVGGTYNPGRLTNADRIALPPASNYYEPLTKSSMEPVGMLYPKPKPFFYKRFGD